LKVYYIFIFLSRGFKPVRKKNLKKIKKLKDLEQKLFVFLKKGLCMRDKYFINLLPYKEIMNYCKKYFKPKKNQEEVNLKYMRII